MEEVNSWDGKERAVRVRVCVIECRKCGRGGHPKVKQRSGKIGLYCGSCGGWQSWITRESKYFREYAALRAEVGAA